LNIGYGIFTGDATTPTQISRVWTNLIPHYAVRVQASLYKIDSWPNNIFFVMADGVTQASVTLDGSSGTSNLCGNSAPIVDSVNTNYNEKIVTIDTTFPHSASSLTLAFLSNLLGVTGAWGIRGLKVTMDACDESCKACTNGSTHAWR
jgi:hypothetical protein